MTEGGIMEMVMSWTDVRIELLKKLWADGLSASQIAAELGGVTRNAVIGKVHRLGLSGRAKTTSSSQARPRKTVAATPAAVPLRSAGMGGGGGAGLSGGAGNANMGGGASIHPTMTSTRGASLHGRMQGSAALKAEISYNEAPDLTPAPVSAADVVVPMSRRVSIMELKEGVCRWPLGDPQHTDFAYCGSDCSSGAPYCGFHSKIAYQPSERRGMSARR